MCMCQQSKSQLMVRTEAIRIIFLLYIFQTTTAAAIKDQNNRRRRSYLSLLNVDTSAIQMKNFGAIFCVVSSLVPWKNFSLF